MNSILSAPIRTAATIWAKHRMCSVGCPKSPMMTLREMLCHAKQTRYGQEHGFLDILHSSDLYDAFRRQIPIIDYDQWVAWLGDLSPLNAVKPLRDQAWPGEIDIFCLSSGTSSGRTKYVPYSREMAMVNRQAALDFFAHIVAERSELAPTLKRTLYMSGSTNIARNEHGALCGDMSALTKYLAPKIMEKLSLPPMHIAALEPWSARLKALTQLCIDNRRIGVISGVPIWQLALLNAIRAETGRPVREAMPGLRCLIHGGMSVASYRDPIQAAVGDEVMLLEIYAASEIGIGAYQLPGEDGMRFWECYRVFYEFEDDDGQVVTSESVKPGEPYSLIVSTCSGLWRYRIGDRVVFRSKSPLMLDYVTRDKTTSTFDEKVTEKNLESAMQGMSPAISDFSLGPDVANRRHTWFLITGDPPGPAWLAELDRRLRQQSEDYDDYRGDGRINPPASVCLSDRGDYLRSLGRDEGGQRKFPRLLSADEVDGLLAHHRDAVVESVD